MIFIAFLMWAELDALSRRLRNDKFDVFLNKLLSIPNWYYVRFTQ